MPLYAGHVQMLYSQYLIIAKLLDTGWITYSSVKDQWLYTIWNISVKEYMYKIFVLNFYIEFIIFNYNQLSLI